VTSWRDSTPQTVQDDLDSLVGPAIDAAEQFLNSRGEFSAIEHRDGGPGLAVLVPYALRGLVRKRARFGDLQLAEGTRRIWT
jgi:hypothetical protein